MCDTAAANSVNTSQHHTTAQTMRAGGLWLAAAAALAVVVALCSSPVNGLYFQIKESETRCFIEEIPLETMVVGECDVVMGGGSGCGGRVW